MGKLVVTTFVTLDGVMQAPGGQEEDTEGGFTHGGWFVPFFDEMMGKQVDEWTQRMSALLLGRKTYEIFAAHWPNVTDPDDGFASVANRVPKYVASRTLPSVEWGGSQLIRGELAVGVAKVKEDTDGEVQVHGSCNMIQTLLKHDLVDEFRLWITPVVLGSGKKLFGEGTIPMGLTFKDAKTSTTGVTIVSYERAGPVQYGHAGT